MHLMDLQGHLTTVNNDYISNQIKLFYCDLS